MKKIIIFLLTLTIFTSVTNSYSQGKLRQNILLRNTPQIAKAIEETVDVLTLRKATNFITKLPVQ